MTATKLFDFLVPVNPIVALKNLIPDLVFHYQSPNSQSDEVYNEVGFLWWSKL